MERVAAALDWSQTGDVKCGPELRSRLVAIGQCSALGVMLSCEGIGDDMPLMDAGVDSLGAVEFRSRPAHDLSTLLPGTLVFDRPTAGEVSSCLRANLGALRGHGESVSTAREVVGALMSLSLRGVTRLFGATGTMRSFEEMV